MATKPNENWQERVYEAFTSNVKPNGSRSLETAIHLCPNGSSGLICCNEAVINGVSSVCPSTAWYTVAVTNVTAIKKLCIIIIRSFLNI